jgi:hypothetical protein
VCPPSVSVLDTVFMTVLLPVCVFGSVLRGLFLFLCVCECPFLVTVGAPSACLYISLCLGVYFWSCVHDALCVSVCVCVCVCVSVCERERERQITAF